MGSDQCVLRTTGDCLQVQALGFLRVPSRDMHHRRDGSVLWLGILKVDESLRVEEAEIYYDPAELFGGLLKGPPISAPPSHACPFSH
ncbi:hypothetical protein CK203_090082 [Vitis vinifera]|uniref:Uncharacterized protein n=1 Tax=Vitis vinifera TaxID=29760 RepID=A0A438E5J5_VITVI|nr:hypothetical protein CK203_090082 [Vitis vinifera]